MANRKPVALLTGASKGIGRDLTGHLLESGYDVVACSRNPPTSQCDGVAHHDTDVRDERQVKLLIRAIEKQHGRLDVLVHCAGVASMNHFLLTPSDSVEKMFSTNMIGTFTVIREAAKAMRHRKSGRIVSISSIAVPLRLPGHASYVASKSALEGLTRSLASELAAFGITINVVGATPVATDMIKGIPEATMEQLIDRLPMQKMGTFADIRNVVDFFLRPDSRSVSGQTIYLGGVSGV